MEPERLRPLLASWYRRQARSLPWRTPAPRDPYLVWVSEAMLQQTRVAAALPYFERWMQRFPTIEALAQATPDEVAAQWAGLGYYRRARSLHEAARILAKQGRGVPGDPEELAALPGFGPYMAAAVASIAHGVPVAAVDGNVTRVVARLLGLRDVASPEGKAAVRRAAEALLDPAAPGDWNEAMMDLGATVCTPRAPRCGGCPWAAGCRAAADGRPERYPAPRRRKPAAGRVWHVAVVQRGRQVLLERGPASGLLAGMWMPPRAATPQALRERLAELGVQGARRAGARPATARHEFSHQSWTMRVHRFVGARPARAVPSPAATAPAATAKWVDAADLGTAGVPAAGRKAFAAVEVGQARVRD